MDDVNANDTFYGLVSGMAQEERLELLRKMQKKGSGSSHLLETSEFDEKEENQLDLKVRINTESLLYRLFLWIRSLFSSDDIQAIYNDDLISRIARGIDSKYPGLINYRHEYLTADFFQKLKGVREAVHLFNEYISVYEKNPGAFYVLLSSILMPEVGESMEKEVNPYSYAVNKEFSVEMRNSLLRKMDEVIQKIPANKKAEMYACIRNVEWLRALCKLPYEKFLSCFTAVIDGIMTCSFNQADGMIENFSKILCTGNIIPDEVLEALYLFNSKQYFIAGNEADNEASGTIFMEKAAASLSVISTFIASVPMRAITRVVSRNAVYNPGEFTGGEDWFIKYKGEWKRLFDLKWEMWVLDCKKELVRNDLTSYFDINEFPLFPKRPWSTLWGGIPYEHELTLGFIYYFMKEQYTKYLGLIKIISIEGDFSSKDNRTEFDEAANKFAEVNKNLDELTIRLNDNGSIGSEFEKVKAQKTKSKGDTEKINAMMSELADFAKDLINVFGSASRMMLKVMRGILGEEADTHFASLSNLSTICGAGNEKFKNDLEDAKSYISHAMDLLKQLEPLDKPIVIK